MKLCVGCDDPAELEAWQLQRYQGGPARHVTRMWPKREAELLDGGSIYWVFKGVMQARQRVLDLEEVLGEDGIRRCALILEPGLVRVAAVPRSVTPASVPAPVSATVPAAVAPAVAAGDTRFVF